MRAATWYVRGWRRDDSYFLTADEILKYLEEDCKKPVLEWFAPPYTIWKISNTPNFPLKQAKAIQDILRAEVLEIR